MTRGLFVERHPSAVAIESAPAAYSPAARQDAADQLAGAMASIIKGLQQTIPDAEEVARTLPHIPAFKGLVREVIKEEMGGIISIAVASFLRDNPVRLNHYYHSVRYRYPLAWLFALIGGLAALIPTVIIMTHVKVTSLIDVANGHRVVVDSMAHYTPWQWLTTIVVTLAGLGLGALVGGLLYKREHRELVDSTRLSAFPMTIREQ
jgi:uncharacterized membrane protein